MTEVNIKPSTSESQSEEAKQRCTAKVAVRFQSSTRRSEIGTRELDVMGK